METIEEASAAGDDRRTIRRATVDDVAILAPLVRAYWQHEEIPPPRGSRISELLAQWLPQTEQCACWLALDGEVPLAYLLAVYALSLEHLGVTAEIDEFYVEPRCRGQGLGARMLAEAEAAFVAHGCTNASLQVARLNEGAGRFYARHGYGQRSRYALMDKTLPHR